MNKKKKRFLSIVALLIILCSPLYDWIPPWPKTITLYGNMPPESHLKAVVPYYTESFLCRDFSFGSGSFLSSGKWNRRYSTVSDNNGNYKIEVPIEMQSFFCRWVNQGILIYFAQKSANTEDRSQWNEIIDISFDGNKKENQSDVECISTYYISNLANKKNIYKIICRNKDTYNKDEPILEKYANVVFDSSETNLHLNIKFKNGPIYKLMNSETKEIKHLWDEFDTYYKIYSK